MLALLGPVALHLLAVAALLPTAVLLAARDLRRSWQLLHGSWRPTVRIVLVVPAPAALNRALNRACLARSRGWCWRRSSRCCCSGAAETESVMSVSRGPRGGSGEAAC
ncbi:hypothetical protein ABZ747_29610 [Kitasatospora cineracea]|uniref:hypothetical protein n=1 Tax=Kitasatospora cineracea TaxID=88074 RepID=UPI0033C803F4